MARLPGARLRVVPGLLRAGPQGDLRHRVHDPAGALGAVPPARDPGRGPLRARRVRGSAQRAARGPAVSDRPVPSADPRGPRPAMAPGRWRRGLRPLLLGLLGVALGGGLVGPVAPGEGPGPIPAFQAVSEAWRPSDLVILDRHGEPVHELRVDPHGRRLPWVPLAETS